MRILSDLTLTWQCPMAAQSSFVAGWIWWRDVWGEPQDRNWTEVAPLMARGISWSWIVFVLQYLPCSVVSHRFAIDREVAPSWWPAASGDCESIPFSNSFDVLWYRIDSRSICKLSLLMLRSISQVPIICKICFVVISICYDAAQHESSVPHLQHTCHYDFCLPHLVGEGLHWQASEDARLDYHCPANSTGDVEVHRNRKLKVSPQICWLYLSNLRGEILFVLLCHININFIRTRSSNFRFAECFWALMSTEMSNNRSHEIFHVAVARSSKLRSLLTCSTVPSDPNQQCHCEAELDV